MCCNRQATCFSAALWVLLTVVFTSLVAGAEVVKVNHKVLVLTIPGWTNYDFLTKVMDGYGVKYTVVPYAVNRSLNFTAFLHNSGGLGAYSAIVQYPSLDLNGYLTKQQVLDLQAYQLKTRARVLRPGVWPWSFGFDSPPACQGQASHNATFVTNTSMGLSGVKPSAALDMTGMYRCPGKLPAARSQCSMWANDFITTGIIQDCNSSVVIKFNADSTLGTDYDQPTMAAAVVTYKDTREEMITTFDCASWKPDCLVFGHYALSWLLRDIIPGQRRVLLNMQMDDFFIETELYNSSDAIVVDSNDTSDIYQTTLEDLTAHADWQQQVNAEYGSNIRLELPFNGNGILDQGGDPNYLLIDSGTCNSTADYVALNCSCNWGQITYATCTDAAPFCRNCTKDWKMPMGSGTNVLNSTYNSSNWDLDLILSNSSLADELVNNKTLLRSFFWMSHTFTHQDLDNITASDARLQWTLNQDMAKLLNITVDDGLSVKGVVTTGISGLFNGNNLQALKNAGYSASVGDNTLPYLVNPTNPYRYKLTTMATSNFDGWKIIPRWATNIYYDCATEDQEVELYNDLYPPDNGINTTLDQIISKEADRVLGQALLVLRHDPHMFHQANLALLDGPKSLVMLWTEAVLGRLTSYVSWPVESIKMDDLVDLYDQREQLETCGLSYTLSLNTTSKTVTQVTVASSTTTGCQAPIMVPITASLSGSGIAPAPAAGAAISTSLITVHGNATTTASAAHLAW